MHRIALLSSLLWTCVLSANAAAEEPANAPPTAGQRLAQYDPDPTSVPAQEPVPTPTPATAPEEAGASAAPGLVRPSQPPAQQATGTAAPEVPPPRAAAGAGAPPPEMTGQQVAAPATPMETAGAATAGTVPTAEAQTGMPPPPPALEPPPPPAAEAPKKSWEVGLSGYFRAPVMLGLSRRGDPDDPSGPRSTQIAFAPNRLVDADYSSFGFTRLNEGDWGELHVTAKREHVAANISYMGWWYAWAGYAQPAASWVPSQAWVTLDSDFDLGGLRPHIDFKGGIFWQWWGTFGKYDTYMFGRFHQAGEALELTVPVNPDLDVRVVHGFGTNRNGSPSSGTGLTLLHYAHAGLAYRELLNLGIYFNDSWTKDPSLFAGPDPAGGGPYADAKQADMTVLGADVDLNGEGFGHLWVASSYINAKNAWALSQTVEVMHSPGGAGIASNYLGWGQPGSTGTGSMLNLGLLYENSLSNLQGKADAPPLPDVTLNLFGMMANTSRDLEPDATLPDQLNQLKWGADVTLTTLPWLAFMLRVDSVHLDLEQSGNSFSVLTPRVIFFSHFLSSESIWLQYSRYFYGNEIALPTSPTQPYSHPDQDVIKLQANMSF
ncbi:hypothetical protein ACFL5O_04340 [Myxococcota bacterium]